MRRGSTNPRGLKAPLSPPNHFVTSSATRPWGCAAACAHRELAAGRAMPAAAAGRVPVDARAYYAEFHGCKEEHLEAVHGAVRRRRAALWLLGDSSLDNKFWFGEEAPAVNGYEDVLRPPRMRQDICYHVNKLLVERGLADDHVCINTAVEATSLNDRALGRLLPQDRFAATHLEGNDTLVVSLGGNDVALQPLVCTILNMLLLVHCTARQPCMAAATACVPNIHAVVGDCGCLLCGAPSCISSSLAAWPPGLGYFVDLFKNRLEVYLQRVVDKARQPPKRVVVCSIYYPCEVRQPSWAGVALGALRYDADPKRLQRVLRAIFVLATSRVRVRGVREVVPLGLHDVLDPLDASDYVARVEPSPVGARKIAAAVLDAAGLLAPAASTPPRPAAAMAR